MGLAAGGARVAPSWLHPNAALRRRLLCRFFCCGTADASDAAMMPPGMSGYLLPRMRSENSAPVAAIPPRGSCFSDADGQIGKHPRGKRSDDAVRRGGRHSADCAGAHPGEGVFPSSGQGGIKGRPLFWIIW